MGTHYTADMVDVLAVGRLAFQPQRQAVRKPLPDTVTITGVYGPADISIAPQRVWRYENGRLRWTLRGKKVEDGRKRSDADAEQNPQDAGQLAGGGP